MGSLGTIRADTTDVFGGGGRGVGVGRDRFEEAAPPGAAAFRVTRCVTMLIKE